MACSRLVVVGQRQDELRYGPLGLIYVSWLIVIKVIIVQITFLLTGDNLRSPHLQYTSVCFSPSPGPCIFLIWQYFPTSKAFKNPPTLPSGTQSLSSLNVCFPCCCTWNLGVIWRLFSWWLFPSKASSSSWAFLLHFSIALVSAVGHLVPPIDSLQALELKFLPFTPLFLLLFHPYLPGTLTLGSVDHQGVCGRIHGIIEHNGERIKSFKLSFKQNLVFKKIIHISKTKNQMNSQTYEQ